jgi:hypothetical protein
MASNYNQGVVQLDQLISPNFYPTLCVTHILEGKVYGEHLKNHPPFKQTFNIYKHLSEKNQNSLILIENPIQNVINTLELQPQMQELSDSPNTTERLNAPASTENQSQARLVNDNNDQIQNDIINFKPGPHQIAENKKNSEKAKQFFFQNTGLQENKTRRYTKKKYEKFTLSGHFEEIMYDGEWVPIHFKTSMNEKPMNRDWKDNSKLALVMAGTGSDKCCFVTFCSANNNYNIHLIEKEADEIKKCLVYHLNRIEKFVDLGRSLTKSQFLKKEFDPTEEIITEIGKYERKEATLKLRGIFPQE